MPCRRATVCVEASPKLPSGRLTCTMTPDKGTGSLRPRLSLRQIDLETMQGNEHHGGKPQRDPKDGFHRMARKLPVCCEGCAGLGVLAATVCILGGTPDGSKM